MKLSSHKNQFVVTALAVMIVVAGYLNFTGQGIKAQKSELTHPKSHSKCQEWM